MRESSRRRCIEPPCFCCDFLYRIKKNNKKTNTLILQSRTLGNQIKLVRGSVGWSACRGLGGGLGPRLWGALARWHVWMREILWSRAGGCAQNRPDKLCIVSSFQKHLLARLCSSAHRLQTRLLCGRVELNGSAALFTPVSLSLRSLCAPLCLALGGWDTQAIFCFLLYNSICRAFPLTVRGCLCTCVPSELWCGQRRTSLMCECVCVCVRR